MNNPPTFAQCLEESSTSRSDTVLVRIIRSGLPDMSFRRSLSPTIGALKAEIEIIHGGPDGGYPANRQELYGLTQSLGPTRLELDTQPLSDFATPIFFLCPSECTCNFCSGQSRSTDLPIGLPAPAPSEDASFPDSLAGEKLFLKVINGEDSFSDCSVVINGHEYPCHRNVLACFEYFQGKFNLEPDNKRVVLPSPSKPETAVEILRYLYCGRVESLSLCADELIHVANELLLEDLRAACAKMVISNLNTENVLQTYVIGDRMQCSELKLAAKQFMTQPRNYATVREAPLWSAFAKANADLVQELLDFAVKNAAPTKSRQ